MSPARFVLVCLLPVSAWAQQPIKAPAAPPPLVDPDLKTRFKLPALKTGERLDVPALPPTQGGLPEARRSAQGSGPSSGQPVLAPMPQEDRVWMDQPGDGRTWARGPGYKASFDGSGMTYIPFLGAQAPRNHPVAFNLRSITVGGRPLALDSAPTVTTTGNVVRIDRGAAIEVYELRTEGVEQKFELPVLPMAGEVVVRIDVTTDLLFATDGAGFRFANELGGVSYGQAFAIAGSGPRTAIESRFDQGSIELRVPVTPATASLPLTIDPLISTFGVQWIPTAPYIVPDIAYDASTDRYLVVWEAAFSATDHDIGSALQDRSGTYVPNTFLYLDISSAHWSAPRVACLAAIDRFLTVAEKGWSPDRQIWGRTRDASGGAGAQFHVSVNGGAGDKLHPDVGGDPNAVPVFWTVVWERTFSATDSDIHAQQVVPDSSLRGGLILIDNSGGTIDTHPAISKSNGRPPATTQDWTIVWQRRFQPADEDIHFAQVHWDGTIRTPSTLASGPIRNDTLPTVSSPTDEVDGSRFVLIGFQAEMTSVNRDIVVTLLRGATPIAGANVSQLEGTFQWRDQITPHVDSDGVRFAITYAEQFSGNDWDVLAATCHVSFGTTIGLSEGRVGLGRQARPELNPRIVSNRSGDGAIVRYAAVWQDQVGSNPLDIDILGALYDGHGPSGMGFAPTGCGGVSMIANGEPALGGAVQFALTGGMATAGVMMLGLPMAPVPVCGACQLGLSPVLFAPGTTLLLPVPRDAQFFGAVVAVQGFTVGIGACNQTLNLSDTITMTVR